MHMAAGHPSPHSTQRRANAHRVEPYVDIGSIIDNAIMHDETELIDDNESPTGTAEGNHDLLAYMAGQQ
jgi:hypothetical protein